ncbi:MAG TPA: RNA 2',3'-cyclic phosphodiesterase [Planctomycetota bacterium]|nr:RNA 2',3'-cyclic phosphodiesterase [Planctomycetota bacterium]
MRCFVALELPEPLQARLACTIAALRGVGDVKWVQQQQLHVTLKFLGDATEPQLLPVRAALAAVRGPLCCSLAGVGHFPSHGAPRVLWAGVAGDTAAMAALAARFDEVGGAVGIAREDRPFHAHVTLGRLRTPQAAGTLLARLAANAAQVHSELLPAPAVTLFASELQPGGSHYTSLLRVALQ